MLQDEEIKCRVCEEAKPSPSFYVRKDTGKRRAECKSCCAVRGARYNKTHKEQKRVAAIAYRAENKEVLKEKKRIEYQNNREVIIKRSAQWAKDNKDKVNASANAWAKRNKAQKNAMTNAYRCRKAQRTPVWADLDAIRDWYVQAESQGLEVDHIVPLRGEFVSGLHVEYNMQLLSRRDNASKGNNYQEGV